MITEVVGLKDSPSETPKILEIRKAQIAMANNNIKSTNLTIISQDCLGGVIYHDTKSQFLSPTINLWFSASDFVKMALNLDFYLTQDLEIISQEPPVTGMLKDIKVHFAHYNSGKDAKQEYYKTKS